MSSLDMFIVLMYIPLLLPLWALLINLFIDLE